MATLSKQTPSITGSTLVWTAADGVNNTMEDAFGCYLLIRSTGNGRTITVEVQEPSNYGETQDESFVVDVSGNIFIFGPCTSRFLALDNTASFVVSANGLGVEFALVDGL